MLILSLAGLKKHEDARESPVSQREGLAVWCVAQGQALSASEHTAVPLHCPKTEFDEHSATNSYEPCPHVHNLPAILLPTPVQLNLPSYPQYKAEHMTRKKKWK